ncbi:MAG: hypothetical protein HFI47_08845 [Lachnospiraceae bacterium]|nr:hypothetical protein [Lachnospiraceae bacterium]
MSLGFSKCDFCIHRHDDNDKGTEFIIYCDAFPEGKPLKEISYKGKDECANGIKYEDENGEYEEFVPEPGSILEQMHLAGSYKPNWE